MAGPTDRFSDPSLGRRGTAALITAVIHCAVLFLALAANNWPEAEIPQAVATFDVSEVGPPKSAPAEPEQPIDIPPQPPEPVVVPPVAIPVPVINPMVVALLEEADAMSSGGGCDLTAPVQAALQANPDVIKSLPSIAPDRRSVANVLALWNQNWVKPDPRLPETALQSVRETVLLTIAAASEACQLQVQQGPRLLYLPVEGETTVLALGSGEWSWKQVADSADPKLMTEQAKFASGKAPQQLETIKGARTLLDNILGR
jgi:hypothetical protein